MSKDVFRRRSLHGGALGLACLLVGLLFDRERFFQSYLLGFLPFASLSLGALALLLLHYVAGGEWGLVIRRILEAASRLFPLLALLFVPVAVGLPWIYEWVEPASDPVLAHKQGYLNATFFLARAVAYFGVWILIAKRLERLSRLSDEAGGRKVTERLQALSAPGLLVYGLTVTFAFIDWAMSIEPHWYSTIYGMRVMVSQVLSALVFSVLALHWLSKESPLREAIRPHHFHSLGNLILAFVMLWAYLAFSQYLIIWSGNLPEETAYYRNRTGGWEALLLALVLFHFAVPFLLLLSRAVKARPAVLASIAGMLLFLRFLDELWLVAPAFHPRELSLHWMDVASLVGVGGIWLWAFLGELPKMPLLPKSDVRFERAPGREVTPMEIHGAT
jgi:hypothetical protein